MDNEEVIEILKKINYWCEDCPLIEECDTTTTCLIDDAKQIAIEVLEGNHG